MTTNKAKRPYRGKHPLRINSVYSLVGRRDAMGVTLNNGEKYIIKASDCQPRGNKTSRPLMPAPSHHISVYPFAEKVRNTCFYLKSNTKDHADVYLRGASGRWTWVATLSPGEFEPSCVLNETQARAHFEANKYPGDWLEI